MSKRVGYLLIAIIVALVGVIFYLLVFQGQTKQPQTVNQMASQGVSQTDNALGSQLPSPSATQQNASPQPTTPEAVVRVFYNQYLSSLASPYKTGAYKANDNLTDTFKHNIAKMRSVGENNDPILCNANKTRNYALDPAQYLGSGDKAQIIMRRSDGTKIYRFALINITGRWIINDTFCLSVSNSAN